jgi:hypothetical protein
MPAASEPDHVVRGEGHAHVVLPLPRSVEGPGQRARTCETEGSSVWFLFGLDVILDRLEQLLGGSAKEYGSPSAQRPDAGGARGPRGSDRATGLALHGAVRA